METMIKMVTKMMMEMRIIGKMGLAHGSLVGFLSYYKMFDVSIVLRTGLVIIVFRTVM